MEIHGIVFSLLAFHNLDFPKNTLYHILSSLNSCSFIFLKEEKMKSLISFCFLVLVLSPSVFPATHTVINSWFYIFSGYHHD